ncbi:IS1182 family transposase [soil metagenome]
MQFIQGNNRTQSILFPESLDQIVDQDNEVRMIDLFVESINISEFKFVIKTTLEGRPAYHPKDLLRLYVYGYLNSIRSSRVLEKECKRNIEVMWLMKQLIPDHNTISNFRRDNEKAIRKVFRYTVSVAKHFDLIGGKLVAGDSTKLRAQNSKKNNFTPKKIEKHINYIDAKLDEYNHALMLADGDNKALIEKEIIKHTERKANYQALQNQLDASGEVQISTSDPESRQMITRNNITEVAYNVQTVVDAKYCIPIDYKVTNENDSKAMGSMLKRSKVILNTNEFTGLFDKGYHTGSEFETASKLGIKVLVAIPNVASHAPDINYDVANFVYDSLNDTYTCPQKIILKTNGRWYNKDRGKSVVQIKQYKTHACSSCPVRNLCTQNKEGRQIERSQHAQFIEQNKINIDSNKEYYKRRQAIVEHPYGIIKRQWGFYYIMTKKGKKRASADVGLMFIAYNLRRIMNILDADILKKFFQELAFFLLGIFVLAKAFRLYMPNTNFRTQSSVF